MTLYTTFIKELHKAEVTYSVRYDVAMM